MIRHYFYPILLIVFVTSLIYIISRPSQPRYIQESFRTRKIPSIPKNDLIKRYKVTLIVPCIKKHATYLPRLIESVKKQTIPHHEVLISLSGCTRKEGKKVSDLLNKIMPVTVYSTSAQKAKAENINRIAKRAEGNVLDIFDADDVMHPQRLEIMLDAKDSLGVEGVMQASAGNPRTHLNPIKYKYNDTHHSYTYLDGNEVFNVFQKNDRHHNDTLELVPTKSKRIWPSELCCVSPIIVDKNKFLRENIYQDEIPGVLKKHTTGEDIIFIRRWINTCKNKGSCIAYVDTPLMKYFPSRKRGEKHWNNIKI